MNRLAIGAMLALALVVPLRADDAAPSKAPWYKRLFGDSDAPKPAPPARPSRDPAREAALIRAHAEEEWVRRTRVCDELRRIADETDNTALRKKADDLERKATDLYKQRTAYLPCSRQMPSLEESALDHRLDSGDAADKLQTPAITVPSRRAQANAGREEKP